MISKETSRAEHEYMNKHPPPINVLATAVFVRRHFGVRDAILQVGQLEIQNGGVADLESVDSLVGRPTV